MGQVTPTLLALSFAELFLEYSKLFLGSAPVLALTTLALVRIFRAEIKGLLNRVATIKFPGGEISTQTSREERADESKKPPAIDASKADLPTGMHLTEENQKQLVEFLQGERTEKTIWEYRYLGYYLVRNTQLVLDWLAGLKQRTTIGAFEAHWLTILPNAREPKAVLEALSQHYLIQIQGQLLEVTPKGREYIQWRGPLPPAG